VWKSLLEKTEELSKQRMTISELLTSQVADVAKQQKKLKEANYKRVSGGEATPTRTVWVWLSLVQRLGPRVGRELKHKSCSRAAVTQTLSLAQATFRVSGEGRRTAVGWCEWDGVGEGAKFTLAM